MERAKTNRWHRVMFVVECGALWTNRANKHAEVLEVLDVRC